jgi:hypothetical protein
MLIINLKRLLLTLVCLVTGLGILSVLKLEATAQTLTNSVSPVVEQANPLNSRESAGVAQIAGVVDSNTIDAYPPQLLKVFPPKESTQSHVQSIGANLNFKLGEGGDLGSLQLFVDRVDVTPQARIANTRDWPSSHVEISYTPNFSEPATHCAEVRFQTLEGKTISHNWCFSVVETTEALSVSTSP